jgi:lambda family phage tail tape measure protein
MALGNLSITVNADVSRFVSNMDAASRAAQSGMGDSTASVEQFQSSLMQAATELERAAKAMSTNMEAANDAIASSTEKSTAALDDLQNAADNVDFKSTSEKFAAAFGAGVGAGATTADNAIGAFKSYVETKLVITGIALIAGVSAAALSAIYVTYKVIKEAIGFIEGLFTGESYKSPSIDALVATNNQIKEIQHSLNLTAQEASATNAAIAALGVNKSDYTSVFSNAASAIRTNTDELDRLGVKYKDANGNLLPLTDTIQNANAVLNEYTVGWDRNQAASSLGLGTAAQVAAAATVTKEAMAAASSRLNDYNLGIGADSQAEVKRYEDAMRDFNRETELTSDGFKRAWADSIMPVLTDFAEFFRDGFPFAVNTFRYSLATITSLFYGLKTVVYIVAESIVGSIAAIGSSLGGVATAGVKVLQGDFTGAKNALIAGWTDAKGRLGEIGDNIVAQARHNADAMKQAWALDDRNASGMANAKGKTWVPKPKEKPDGPADDPAKTILEGYLKSEDALIAAEKKSMDTRTAFLKQSYDSEYINARTYYDERRKLIADNYAETLAAYDKEAAAVVKYKAALSTDTDKVKIAAADVKLIEIAAKRAAAEAEASSAMIKAGSEQLKIYSDFNRATIEWIRNQELSNAQQQFSIDLMGKSTLEVAKLTAAHKVDLEVQERIRQLRLKDPNADVSGALAAGSAQTQKAIDLIQQQNDKQKDPWFNARESIRKYGEAANDVGTQIGNAMDNAFKGAEDAFVNFVQTGKLSFKSLATSILADIERILIKKAIAGIVDMAVGGFSSGFSFGSGGSTGSGTGSSGLWAGGDAGASMDVMSAASGYDVPSGVNPLTQLHENEMVLPAQQADVIRGLAGNPPASSGDISVNITVNAQTGDSTTSSTGNAQQMTQLGTLIAAKVREVIVTEKRSGGLLAT